MQRPLELGFDIVMHSATKYLNGHSDVVGGVAVVGDDPDLRRARLGFLQNAVGGVAGPFDSFLALRGIKTLALRMERHCASRARDRALAREAQPRVERVRLSRPARPTRSTRWPKRQMRGFGGMITFFLKGGLDGVAPVPRARARSSRSPRASAASRASSSTRRS